MDLENASIVVALLESVARAQMEASAALAKWPPRTESDNLLDASWHDLSHFASDDDVRQSDPRYRAYQVSLLLSRVQQIKAKFGIP
jgi:hypothetical protein